MRPAKSEVNADKTDVIVACSKDANETPAHFHENHNDRRNREVT